MTKKELVMTQQRRVILEELMNMKRHPTADEVYEHVKKRLPKISLSTVYRNLDVLSDNGLIQKVYSSGSQMRFDGNPARHYHVRCVECGRVDDVAVGLAGDLDQVLDVVSDYTLLGHKLEFLGYCPECRNQREGAEGQQQPGA